MSDPNIEIVMRSRDAWKNVAMHLAGQLGEARETIQFLEEAVSAGRVIESLLRGQLELSKAMEEQT